MSLISSPAQLQLLTLLCNYESSGTMTDQQEYVMNTSSMKFHLPSCSSVSSIKDENKATYQGPREDLIAEGYEPCGRCNP